MIIHSLTSEWCEIQTITKWPAKTYVPPVFLKRKSCEYKKILYQKIQKKSSKFWIFNFHFKWKWKLWLNNGIVLQTDFSFRLLIWTVLKDHFAKLWSMRILSQTCNVRKFCKELCTSSCRLHVFHAWIERSIKLSFNGFLFICCWDHFVHILKTCQSQ